MPRRTPCGSTMAFGDDYSDNECTFHCQLEAGHPGLHQETGTLYGIQRYTVIWADEEKRPDDQEEGIGG